MNSKWHNRMNIRTIIMYLVIIAILIDTSTMYRYLTNSPLYGRGFGWPLGLICLAYVILTPGIRVTRTHSLRFNFLVILLLIYAVASGYKIKKFLVSYVGIFVIMFIFAYALYQNEEMKQFLHAFSNVMIAMAVISLICWLFGSVMQILPGRTELTYYWAEKYRVTHTYYYIYFENPSQNIGHESLCNLGVFAEAPGYSGFLTYALLIELILRKGITEKKQRRWTLVRIGILMLTLFTTDSTKGIIAVLIALGIEYLSKETKTQSKKVLKIIGVIGVIAVATFVSASLISSKMDTVSGTTRLDDLRSGFLTFVQHPVFGAGYGNVDAIIANRLRVSEKKGLSMGLTVLLAYGGLWMFGIYCGAAVVSFRNSYFRANRKTWFLIVIILLYNLFISNSGFSNPYIFAVAAAYAAPQVEIGMRQELSDICSQA